MRTPNAYCLGERTQTVAVYIRKQRTLQQQRAEICKLGNVQVSAAHGIYTLPWFAVNAFTVSNPVLVARHCTESGRVAVGCRVTTETGTSMGAS